MIILDIIIIVVCVILVSSYYVIFYLIRRYGSNNNNNYYHNGTYNPKVSIFLPTYNEEDNIKRKLENILQQDYPIYEIMVYDCSTDKTPNIVEKLSKNYPIIRLIRQPKRIGLAKTINQSIRDAKGDIWVKTDCDSLIGSKHGLRRLIEVLSDPKIGGASGVDIKDAGIEREYRSFMTKLQIAESNIDSILIPHGALEAFKKELMEEIDPESTADDVEQAIIVRRKGYRVVIDNNVLLEEDIPSNFKLRRKMKDRRAQGMIKVLLDNLDMLFNKRYGKCGTIIYPLEFFITIISPWLLISLLTLILFRIYLYNPLLTLISISVIGIALVKSKVLRAVVDTQLSCLIGFSKTIFNKKEPLWEKAREVNQKEEVIR